MGLARQSVRTRLRLWSLKVLDSGLARFVPQRGAADSWRKRAFRWARFFLFVGSGGCGLGCLMRRGKVNKSKVSQTEVDACYHTPWTKGFVKSTPNIYHAFYVLGFAPTRSRICIYFQKASCCLLCPSSTYRARQVLTLALCTYRARPILCLGFLPSSRMTT